MTNRDQHWLKSRHIVERIVIKGDLELQTPAHFGSGEAEGTADLSLLTDPYEGAALLPGASIAGALRNYWRERKWGYGAEDRHSELFGARRFRQAEMDGEQSLLIVEDAFGPVSRGGSYPKPQVELRDGVKIDGQTRTADEKKLFDVELLRAGTQFALRFELVIDERPPEGMSWNEYEALSREERAAHRDSRRKMLCTELALALEGFERGEIGLGARKRRGFGRCKVDQWHVWRYDLTAADGLLAWLAEERAGKGWKAYNLVREAEGRSLAEKLDVTVDGIPDMRRRFDMIAGFRLDGSLLVRSGQGEADLGPDAVHLHRPAYGDEEGDRMTPILPGTSLAGVLRARALRIANTLSPDRVRAGRLINQLFGIGPEDPDWKDEKNRRASRLVVHEAELEDVHTLVQTRIQVDRFTGGAMDNYLFSEAPVFGASRSRVTVNLVLQDPREYEVGLLLLLLKDLWTGDLPVGGESSVGRGRLQGLSAELTHRQNGTTTRWTIEPEKSDSSEAEVLKVVAEPELDDVRGSLEAFVQALNDHLSGR